MGTLLPLLQQAGGNQGSQGGLGTAPSERFRWRWDVDRSQELAKALAAPAGGSGYEVAGVFVLAPGAQGGRFEWLQVDAENWREKFAEMFLASGSGVAGGGGPVPAVTPLVMVRRSSSTTSKFAQDAGRFTAIANESPASSQETIAGLQHATTREGAAGIFPYEDSPGGHNTPKPAIFKDRRQSVPWDSQSHSQPAVDSPPKYYLKHHTYGIGAYFWGPDKDVWREYIDYFATPEQKLDRVLRCDVTGSVWDVNAQTLGRPGAVTEATVAYGTAGSGHTEEEKEYDQEWDAEPFDVVRPSLFQRRKKYVDVLNWISSKAGDDAGGRSPFLGVAELLSYASSFPE